MKVISFLAISGDFGRDRRGAVHHPFDRLVQQEVFRLLDQIVIANIYFSFSGMQAPNTTNTKSRSVTVADIFPPDLSIDIVQPKLSWTP